MEKGGITVIILLILSVVSFAVIIERAVVHRRFKARLDELYDAISRTIIDNGVAAVAALCQEIKSPLGPVILAGLAKKEKGRDDVMRSMELAGRIELGRLDRFVGVLGTIGSTAPFIGLFGTVLGIIRAFSDLAIAQGSTPAAVADGIAEALVATATGLFVAIPAVVAYNYFVRAAGRRSLELEARATEFADKIVEYGAMNKKDYQG